jgi:hypothetical protein
VDLIQCDFGGIRGGALYKNMFIVYCVVPPLPRNGRVPFQLLINTHVLLETTFDACEYHAFAVTC